MQKEALSKFIKIFSDKPQVVVRAPGRLELLGNHTDYNGGYILAVAVDLYTTILARKNNSSRVRLYTREFNRQTEFDLSEITQNPEAKWADYVKGVIVELKKAQVSLDGFDAFIYTSIPMGMGLSSSAALETATAYTVGELFGHKVEGMELAKLCRRAENDFVGSRCGILDQFCSVFGKEHSALFLDCLTLEHEVIDFDDSNCALVVADSAVEHSIAEGEYSTRHRECFSAAALIGKVLHRKIKLLREVQPEEFQQAADKLPEIERKRARHIVEENQRVLAGVSAVKAGEIEKLGQLMFESHRSSSTLFENSCEELDALVKIAAKHPAAIGAKLSGGGFGGCTANLVRKEGVGDFAAYIKNEYQKTIGKHTATITCSIGHGAVKLPYRS